MGRGVYAIARKHGSESMLASFTRWIESKARYNVERKEMKVAKYPLNMTSLN